MQSNRNVVERMFGMLFGEKPDLIYQIGLDLKYTRRISVLPC